MAEAPWKGLQPLGGDTMTDAIERFPGLLHHHGRAVALKYHKLLSGSGRYPPNSLSALHEVLGGRAAVIEFDVGLLGDGAYVLMHDATVERETDGVGALTGVTSSSVRGLRLRGSAEQPALLDEVVSVLAKVDYPLKVQVDLKAFLPLDVLHARILLEALAPLREKTNLRVVVGCLADWNLRTLRRLDRELAIGLDFAYHLDAPVEGLVRLPLRTNAYGYLDDHPLGFRSHLPVETYLRDRIEVLLGLVVDIGEVYLRKEFVRRALDDGFNPVTFVRELRPGVVVDVWTIDRGIDGAREQLEDALTAGADQITTNTALQWAEEFGAADGAATAP